MFWGKVKNEKNINFEKKKYLKMKTKLFFISTLFLMQSLFSQCISIELSVTWEISNDIFCKDTMKNIPMLHITYRNNCASDYYFLKVSDNKNSLPPIGCGIMFHYPDEYYLYPNYLKRAKSHQNYANQDFKVRIGGGLFYLNSWDILNDTVDFYNVHADAVVSCDLQDIYEYICRVEKFEDNTKRTPEGAMKLEFEPEDLYPENLLNSAGDRFLLIKSGETYTDTYNLVAFQIVEGCYTFFIAQEDIKDYVLYTETIFTDKDWTINEKGEITVKNIEQKLELPPVVGEYQLYSGGFNTNKVTVCFGEK